MSFDSDTLFKVADRLDSDTLFKVADRLVDMTGEIQEARATYPVGSMSYERCSAKLGALQLLANEMYRTARQGDAHPLKEWGWGG